MSTWPAHGIFSRDGKLFWVTSETAGNVTVVDVPQRKILEVLPSSGDAMGLALAADGHFVFAANGEDRTVSKIDTRTHRIVATGKVKGVNHDAVLTPDGRFLYVTLRKANRIAVLRSRGPRGRHRDSPARVSRPRGDGERRHQGVRLEPARRTS